MARHRAPDSQRWGSVLRCELSVARSLTVVGADRKSYVKRHICRVVGETGQVTVAEARGRPDDASIRRALVRCGFNTKQRSEPPDEVAEVLAGGKEQRSSVSAGRS